MFAVPSWNPGPSRDALVGFIARVTTRGRDFVPAELRVAVFDNDGTLWTEQPYYNQIAFALQRANADPVAVAAKGEPGLAQLLADSHAGMSTEEFAAIVERWIRTARHPTLGRLYTELTYVPMRELIAYLHEHEFKVFIVSGGGVEFMRVWVERVYGVPKERVIGSRAKVKYEVHDRTPVLMRLAEVDLVDSKAGKPVGIHQQIGRRPILAFGNSDGDFEMLEWTTSVPGPHLGLLLHHTDAAREFAYDRDASVGRLSKTLDEAPRRGWVVVDMKRDWSRVFT